MKNFIYIFLLFTFLACESDDDGEQLAPIDQLPAATQTGANTIGCLVNGKAFTDSGLMNNFYQYVNGQHHLAINASYLEGELRENLRIRYRGLVEEGNTYILNNNSLINPDYIGGNGNYSFSENPMEGGDEYHTNSTHTGEIYFSRFDEEAGIMSGTFYFKAQEMTTGEIIEITDGRFDLTFTN